METKMMKYMKISLWKWVLGACMLFVGVQSAWSMACDGTIYIKLPKTWTTATINMDGTNYPFSTVATSQNGWFVINASTLGATYSKEFIIMQTAGGWNDGGITTKDYGVSGGNGGWSQADKFSCTDIAATGELYIYENPTTPNKTSYTGAPPDAKYIYMMVPPDFLEWMSSVPMISMDGGKTGKMMKADPDKCGWYYYVWFGEPVTNSVVFFREDDPIDPSTGRREDMIGNNGNWEESDTATWIPLKDYFDDISDTLYFVPDENQFVNEGDIGWYKEYPSEAEGVCEYDLAALIYDTDASLHGAFTCNPDWHNGIENENPGAAANACFYAAAPYNVVANTQGKVPCIGITPGMVTDLLDHNEASPTYKKPRLTDAGKACFGAQADQAFAAMFNSTPGVNETYCVDMPFHKSADNKWEFDSDTYEGPDGAKYTVPGGFYPAETTPPVTKMLSDYLPAAENKRKAEGPVFMCEALRALHPGELVPYSDVVCNGPGWNGGIDCKGLYKGGSEFNAADFPGFKGVTLTNDGWAWGCPNEAPMGWTFYSNKANARETPVGKVTAKGQIPGDSDSRWASGASDSQVLTTGGRNQHFCFESHATFTHKPGLRFSFRGDDDIWVYIDNKLAVDLGGTHLAAPGYVDLDAFLGETGALVAGQTYDLDIFFCDRRTTMSNVRIKTNMYIRQSTGIEMKTKSLGSGNLEIDLCVVKSGGGDCAAAAQKKNGEEKTKECGEEITTEVSYAILTRKKQPVENCSDCAALTPYVKNHGGIDLTNPKIPKFNQDAINGLPPGTYYLAITVEGKTAYHKFKVKGNLDVVTHDVEFVNSDGDDNIYPSGTKWKFEGMGLAGTRIPIYISAPDDQGTVDLASAANQTYTLTLSAGVSLYKNKEDTTPLSAPYNGKIDENGIDTLWVEVPLAGLTAAETKVTASVRNAVATLSFYAPQLSFAKPKTTDSLGNVVEWTTIDQDPDVDEDGDEYFHWVNADVDFYLIVLNPATGALCTECNFALDLLDASSGVAGDVSALVDGVALVRIRSSKVYDDPSQPAATMLVGAVANPAVAAPYGNMHFFKPPAPMPLIVDMFDVKGAPTGEMNISSKFYKENADYLDGRADSMAVIYDRAIHPDSIPFFLCLNFDEKHLVKINPYDLGYSSNPKDKEMFCSTQFSAAEIKEAYDKSPDNGQTLVFAVDDPFTADVKTLVLTDDRIASFTTYKWKGEIVKSFFEGHLTDRMAPIILSARASAETDGGVYDQVKIVASEPVMVLDGSVATSAFSYYLNSAVDEAFKDEEAKYIHVESQNSPQNKRDTLTLRYYNDDKLKPTPHVGDYIRFRADNVVWADSSNGAAPGADTLRPADDATWHWNSPTNYNATNRLPSPWVQVVGDAKIDVTTIPFNIADPSVVNDNTPVGEVFPVKTSENMDDIKSAHPNTLGHFVQSDMGSIIGADTSFTRVYQNNPHDIYFFYEVDYYTNLGSFVAHQSGKIFCDDAFFSADPTQEGAVGDCVKNPRNFFVAWNMLSDKHRLVGTGAYITKYSSFVKLGSVGTKGKKEKTEVWGVKRGTGVVKK